MAGVVLGSSWPDPALPAEPAYGPGEPRCSVRDTRLAEASGLAVDGERLFMVNDGGDSLEVYVVDGQCRVDSVITAPSDPYDVEDLARATDGTLWLADIGDNDLDRETVALHALREDGQSVLFRFTYPDGAHDAEALLLDPAGRPYIVTKDVLGDSGVYTPAGSPAPDRSTPLERVLGLQFDSTGTPGGPLDAIGQRVVTGGAVSADGTLAVLRTYTDAYVYPVVDGDLPAALAGTPARVPLPPAPQGEAISFAANGRDLVVTSEGSPFDVTVLPARTAASEAATSEAATSEAATGAPRGGPGVESEGNSWPADLAVAAFLAALLVGVFGMFQRRRG